MSKVEDDLVAIKIELAVMKAQLANCATKADIAELKAEIKAAENRMVLWVVSVFILAQVLPPLMHKLGL